MKKVSGKKERDAEEEEAERKQKSSAKPSDGAIEDVAENQVPKDVLGDQEEEDVIF